MFNFFIIFSKRFKYVLVKRGLVKMVMTSKEPEIMNEAEEDSDASVTIDDLCEDLESLY
jgi:hypothetical protein